MSTPVAHHCPDCKAEISADLRSCIQCGADVGLWPESQRTPLILPGNPALSVDVVRKRASIPKLALGTTLAAAVVGAVLYNMPERETDDAPAVVAVAADSAEVISAPPAPLTAAAPAPDEPLVADSLAAFSGGDTALSSSIPSTPTVAPPAAPTAAPTATSLPVPAPAPVAAAPAIRRTPATPAAAARPTERRAEPAVTRATPPAPMPAPAQPVLTLGPVVSTSMLPGERMQLRWTVSDRRTRTPIRGTRVEFTSTNASVANVDARSGLVIARTPGSARIIIDGGAAGQRAIALVVRAPAPAPAPVVTATPAAGADGPRTTAASTPPTAPATSRDTPRSDMPDADDVRTVVDRFIRDVRRDAVRNFEVTQFLADGAEHRVTLVSGPTVVSNTAMGVRVAFSMRLTKFDGGGRPVTRVSSVTMDVDKRDGQPASSAVAIGALRRP